MYAYTANNPVMRIDPNGYKWWHWAAAVGVVAVLAVAVVVTAGGAAPAIAAVAMAANGICAGTPALSVASFAFVGASTALAGTALIAGLDSISSSGFDANKFAEYGEEAFIATTAGGILGGLEGFTSCFVAGTLIKTIDGDKPIEDIKVGDLVYAEDPDTGEKELKPVVNLFINEKTELVHIKVKDQEITTTNEHPFYIPDKGWTAAINLRAGDQLVLLSGEIAIIEFTLHEILETPITVYNFEVEDFHTYYVSELGILVHNMCTTPNQLQKQVEIGQAPKGLDRVDMPHVDGQKPHIHFTDGTSLNKDGSIHDKHKGIHNPSNKIIDWLTKNGWKSNK